MALPPCEECKAIYRELMELVESAHRTKPGAGATLEQLVAWMEERAEDPDYRTRVRLTLSTLTRRMVEHDKATGHHVPQPLPPRGGMTSLN